jgi:hypothetical protein
LRRHTAATGGKTGCCVTLEQAIGYTWREGAAVIRTVEAIIDEKGQVSLLEPVHPSSARRALVTILDEEPVAETALLSEAVLSEDWDRAEEDAAWAHLQPAQ